VAIQRTTSVINDLLDGLDAVFNSGLLDVYTGTAPATANLAASGTLLASITLPADSFAAATAAAKAKAGTWQDASADATGTAAHFRLKTSSDTNANTQNERRVDGSVTLTAGGGDMTVDSTSFTAGQVFTVTAFNLTGT